MNRIKLFEDFLNSSELNIYDKPKFVEVLEETIYPSSFICSYVASAIKMLEGNGVKIYGFSYDENPTSVYFSEEELQEGPSGSEGSGSTLISFLKSTVISVI